MPDNGIQTDIKLTPSFNGAADMIPMPADNFTPLILASGKQVEWSFAAMANDKNPNVMDPSNIKIRFKGEDGVQHEIMYEPQDAGYHTGGPTFDGSKPQTYKFASTSVDGQYLDRSGTVRNADDDKAGKLTTSEYTRLDNQAVGLLKDLSATGVFKDGINLTIEAGVNINTVRPTTSYDPLSVPLPAPGGR